MTPYLLEFVLAVTAAIGTWLVVTEMSRLLRWWSMLFFLLFGIAPIWFAIAHFRLIALGNPDWVLNRWMSMGVRVPLTLGLYVLWWGLRRVDDD